MSSVIDAKNLLGNQLSDLGGGVATINKSTLDIGAGDTPHDFKPGRTAGDDAGDEDGDDIDVSQEEAVLIAAGEALYHSQVLDNAQTTPPPALPPYKDSEPGMQYLSDALNTLTNNQIGSVNNYERRMETFILNQDVIKTNFGSTTTVYIQDVLSAWDTWHTQPEGPNKPERPQFWCDICGKSTDAVSKALIDKTIDLKWNPSDTRYDPNKIYKKVSNGKFDSEKLRVLANFIITYMHPEENAGSIKAAFVFDMHSGSIGKAVAVLNQINTAIIPQVVSDSASTNMEQIPSGKNILWFPTTNPEGNEYEYQANIYTFPLGIRLVIRVAEGDVGTHYNNKNDAFMNNFKIILRYGGVPSPPDGSLMAIAQQIFAGNEYELNFRLDASNVGASVAYLASIIYAMKNNQTPSGLVLIPNAINECTPTHSNMINISNLFATLANNINTSSLGFQQKSKAYNILCFLLFDIKRSGDWEQARACFYLPEDIIGKPLFCTGDILCSVFARMIGANSIWRAPKAGSIKDWYFRIHRKVNKQLDQDVKNAIELVQQCNDIVKVIESVNGIQPLVVLLQTLSANAEAAAQNGIFKMPGKNNDILIRVQQIITYIARCRAADIRYYIDALLPELQTVVELFEQCFPGLDSDGIYNTFTLPLKTLVNMFYAIGNPQPQNAASFNKKVAIQTFSRLFSPDPSQAIQAFSGADARVNMMVEDPAKIIDENDFITVTSINVQECMRRINFLFAYEQTMSQDQAFGSLNKALTRLQIIAGSGTRFSTLYGKIADSGINRQNIEIVDETVNPKRITSQVIFDIGTKSPNDLVMNQDGSFNKGFRSSTFNYTASSLQKMGHQLKQHFSALTTSGGIRFQTSTDNFIGNPMDNLNLFENIMKQRLDKNAIIKRLNQRIKQNAFTTNLLPGETPYANAEQIKEEIRGIKVVQIAPPPFVLEPNENDNKNSVQKVFCRSLPGYFGSWHGLSAEKGKGSYKTFASESLDFKNDISSELMTKGMGFLSGFTMKNLKKELLPYESYYAASPFNYLFIGEKQLYQVLSYSNRQSFAGFKLFNMASPEWDKLEGGRASIELCEIALRSKAAMATWFYEMFQLPDGLDINRGALTQYIVPPIASWPPELVAALSRLHGASASADTKTSQWQTYGRTILQGVWDAPSTIYSNDIAGYNQLISDTVMLINSFSRNLPMIYLTLSLYAYNMKIILPEENRAQAYLTVDGQIIKIGFIISEAVESACLYSGVDNANKDINDTILASLQCVNIYSNIQIPGPASFQGGGGIIQKGGAPTDDDRDSQNKMIQDLYYNVTGIASSGIITLLSTRLQLNDGSVISVFDITNPEQPSILNTIDEQFGGGKNYMQAFEILLIILTLEAKGLNMQLLSNAVQQGDQASASVFLQSQGIENDMLIEAGLLFADGRLNNVIQIMATVQENKLKDLAFSMKAYSDQVKSVWGQEMEIITSNNTFTYTPTFTDFILSTSFATSGNISGECDIDIPFLYGIYYDGPLDNIADSSEFMTTSLNDSFPGAPAAFNVATGLPSFMSLLKYATGQTTLDQLGPSNMVADYTNLYAYTVLDGNVGKAPLFNQDEAVKPSFMLYQLIKVCYPDGLPSPQSPEDAKRRVLRRLEENVRLFIDDQSAYPTIPVVLQRANAASCFFISPAFKTLQTLSLIGSLLNITPDAALTNANTNINVVLQANQLNDHRASMITRITEIYRGIQQYIQTQQQLQADQTQQLLVEIRNLIDMLNQMNGYNLVDPATDAYYPPGQVDFAYLQSQQNTNPIPPLPYPADLTNIQEVLNIMIENCQSNKDGGGFNTTYVGNQIRQNYEASGMPLNFSSDTLANFAFNNLNQQTKTKIAFYNYFYKPWVTVNWENAQDPILNLYRFILFYAVKGEELAGVFPDNSEIQGLLGLTGGKKSKTRKNRKKKHHTRRNRDNNKKNRTKYRRHMHKKYTKKHKH